MPEQTPKLNGKPEPAIWTVTDVADYLRMSRSKVYRLVKDRELPAARIGKTLRFRKDLLDNWLSQRTESSMKAAGSSDEPE